MKIEITQDKQKAKSLLKMAETTLKRLEETDKVKYPSNTLDDYYDIIHQLMEALTLLEGIKIKGEGAHYELIGYISKKHDLGLAKRNFLQELRKYRNKISYEGFYVNKDYIKRNEPRINKIIKQFLELIRNKLK